MATAKSQKKPSKSQKLAQEAMKLAVKDSKEELKGKEIITETVHYPKDAWEKSMKKNLKKRITQAKAQGMKAVEESTKKGPKKATKKVAETPCKPTTEERKIKAQKAVAVKTGKKKGFFAKVFGS